MEQVKSKKQKVFVANRSEIACRVFQAARELGMTTVGVVAPGDESARHVTFADEVLPVKSYLDIDELIGAIQTSQADFVHPGYGFLSERPEFVEAIEKKTDAEFLGPRAETMRIMGGKITAKDLAEKEGVPTLPWARIESLDCLSEEAQKIGFPLLLKAAAGGGGKGMRRVDSSEDLKDAAESAIAEAVSAFGDGTLFLEKLVEKPRHIEVQVFGDGKGGGAHLFERECSLQRRHQKVWEEAPAIRMKESTRQGLFAASMNLVRATKYRSAGTVEFLMDEDENFYFLEMNTRLQVEHPVTELVTCRDLVWAQIQLAQGPQKFEFSAPEKALGHAIEVRVYAENPALGYVPTPGPVHELKWPTGTGIRVESGIEVGQTITTSFDSMLAKIITYGENRDQALRRMRVALDDTVIHGMGTNLLFLRRLCDHENVIQGDVHTHFLETEFSFGGEIQTEKAGIMQAAREAGVALSRGSASTGESAGESGFPSPWNAF